MAEFKKRALTRFAVSPYADNSKICAYFYGTNDTAAEIITAGYWNDARDQLNPGDVIFAMADIDGTPDLVIVTIDTVPVSANVTSSAETGAVGA
ncbi:MAG: hypothetical protein JKY94_09910 [Rhodobacteraceae bacterium]|nr:hypothetical protein [Paracoccaceae bacterium]